ncbi:hypothetical protein R3P38DRAFT_2778362 [Favolaschia claudopus]|uniref:Uncharacterized protein n=1 Tax=Favolaschia claudopus TaxID=2862362 RepID=A0AAW0BJ85_9AGAR
MSTGGLPLTTVLIPIAHRKSTVLQIHPASEFFVSDENALNQLKSGPLYVATRLTYRVNEAQSERSKLVGSSTSNGSQIALVAQNRYRGSDFELDGHNGSSESVKKEVEQESLDRWQRVLSESENDSLSRESGDSDSKDVAVYGDSYSARYSSADEQSSGEMDNEDEGIFKPAQFEAEGAYQSAECPEIEDLNLRHKP